MCSCVTRPTADCSFSLHIQIIVCSEAIHVRCRNFHRHSRREYGFPFIWPILRCSFSGIVMWPLSRTVKRNQSSSSSSTCKFFQRSAMLSIVWNSGLLLLDRIDHTSLYVHLQLQHIRHLVHNIELIRLLAHCDTISRARVGVVWRKVLYLRECLFFASLSRCHGWRSVIHFFPFLLPNGSRTLCRQWLYTSRCGMWLSVFIAIAIALLLFSIQWPSFG